MSELQKDLSAILDNYIDGRYSGWGAYFKGYFVDRKSEERGASVASLQVSLNALTGVDSAIRRKFRPLLEEFCGKLRDQSEAILADDGAEHAQAIKASGSLDKMLQDIYVLVPEWRPAAAQTIEEAKAGADAAADAEKRAAAEEAVRATGKTAAEQAAAAALKKAEQVAEEKAIAEMMAQEAAAREAAIEAEKAAAKEIAAIPKPAPASRAPRRPAPSVPSSVVTVIRPAQPPEQAAMEEKPKPRRRRRRGHRGAPVDPAKMGLRLLLPGEVPDLSSGVVTRAQARRRQQEVAFTKALVADQLPGADAGASASKPKEDTSAVHTAGVFARREREAARVDALLGRAGRPKSSGKATDIWGDDSDDGDVTCMSFKQFTGGS